MTRHWQIANATQLYGFCLGKLGRYAEGERYLLAGLRVIENQLGADHWRADTTRARLRELYELWGQPDRAEGTIDPE